MQRARNMAAMPSAAGAAQGELEVRKCIEAQASVSSESVHYRGGLLEQAAWGLKETRKNLAQMVWAV